MSAKLRVTVAVVHTGSRLVRLACGTKISVFVLAPMAGRASGNAAVAAAAARKARLFIVVSSVTYLSRQDTLFRCLRHSSRDAGARAHLDEFLGRGRMDADGAI